MPELTEHLLSSFRAALRKEAGFADAVARAAPRLRAAGSLAGTGAAIGALGGAGLGATRRFQEAREHGEGIGSAALHGAHGALGGAVSGAGVGALAGGGIGALSSRGAGLAARAGALGAPARFGQRQLHSLTGMLAPAELEAIGGGAAGAQQAFNAALAAGAPAGRLAKAEKALSASRKAQNMGLTSIPGYLNSVKNNGLGSTLAAGAKDQWHNTSPAFTALMVGVPAATAAGTLMKKENPTGPGKGEELGRNLGGVVGGIAGSAMPIAGNMIVGGALSSAGGRIGKGIDWMRGRRQASPMMGPPPLEPAEGQHIPSERVMSPAAAGQQPEVGL